MIFGRVEFLRLIFSCLLLIFFIGQGFSRSKETINSGWRFYRSEAFEPFQVDYDDSHWEVVNLPHTYNKDALAHSMYYRGTAWYRKSFSIQNADEHTRKYLEFEGVFQEAYVYVNGQYVGEHLGGYSTFRLDITDYLREGKNVFAVKVNNSFNDMIPPLHGDFTKWGGIYRDVHLVTTGKVHFDLTGFGADGVYLTTSSINESNAKLLVKADITNHLENSPSLEFRLDIYDETGGLFSTVSKDIIVNRSGSVSTSFDVDGYSLWSPGNPYLYKVVASITDKGTGQVYDRLSFSYGFRWFELDPNKGFFLNGEHLKLMGVSRHQDYRSIGNALSDEIHREDIRLIKEMGANFIRLGHYPQDPAVLEACNKLGLVVWEEISLVGTITLDQRFYDRCENMMKEMVYQHYNHPSIAFWGVMNEGILGTMRHEPDSLRREAKFKQTAHIGKQLSQFVEDADPNRYSVIALPGGAAKLNARLGFSEIPHAVGSNIYYGWYGGTFETLGEHMDREHKAYPQKPLMISEYGAGSDARIHSLNPEQFDFSIEYQQLFHESYLPQIMSRDYLWGGLAWVFADFYAAHREESMPRINNKGLVYTDRSKKDIYYYYKSVFSDAPVVHIASRDWKSRVARSDKGFALHPIKVYSNQPDVTLFLNGKRISSKRIRNYHAVWDIPLKAGSNIIEAIAGDTRDVFTIDLELKPASLQDSKNKPLEIAMNIGSTAYYTDPGSGFTWEPERDYKKGAWGVKGGHVFRFVDEFAGFTEQDKKATNRLGIIREITGTIHEPLFQTFREDIRSISFDVPDGDYELELCFVEYQESPEVERVFSVSVNGDEVMPLLNIAEEYGVLTAVRKKFRFNSIGSDGLMVEFKPGTGKTICSAVKIRKVD